MTCHCDNIFTGKNRYRERKSILVPGRSCLQAAINHAVPIGRYNRNLTKVFDNHWKIPPSPTYDCSFGKTIVNTYHNFHVRTYKAQLVGAANVIEQHLTTTSCSATIDTTLHMGSCIPPGKSQPHYCVERPSSQPPGNEYTLYTNRGHTSWYPPYTLVEPFKRN